MPPPPPDPRFTKDMAVYWRNEYADWNEPGKSTNRFVQSLKRIGTRPEVLSFVRLVLDGKIF